MCYDIEFVSPISPVFVFISFFFLRADVHRNLHSFPTRRSSDLSVTMRTCLREVFPDQWGPIQDIQFKIRSEEHTSELQSHHDLVCRLLLEKKKHLLRFTLLYLLTRHSPLLHTFRR